MPFSGGIWTPPSLPGSWSPAISGQAATPADWNTLLTAIAAGLSTMICKDGQSTVAADIPFAGFRLKGVGAGVLVSDAANVGQLQDGSGTYAADTGTADHYAIAPTPAISAYAVGQLFRWKVLHTNLTTTPDLAVSGLTAGTIVWPDGTALIASALPAGAEVQTVVSAVSVGTPTHQLVTVASPPVNQSTTAPTTQNFTSGSAATYTRPAGVKWIKVRFVGAGGGGGGSGGTTGPTGATGGATIFNSINANGGLGGVGTTSGAAAAGGAGGTAGTGTATLRVTGQNGGASFFPGGANSDTGSTGGSAPFFGGGGASISSTSPTNGAAGVANTGGGGGGAISPTTTAGSGAGGSGEYVELIIANPAGTYTYTVGASGAGGIGTGTGAATGGAGAAGFITVEEHYNYG